MSFLKSCFNSGMALVRWSIIILGIFTFFIVAHEGYHYFSIDGTPTGICFGFCDLYGSYDDSGMDVYPWATAAIRWEVAEDYEIDLKKEERNANIFSFLSTLLLLCLIAIDENMWYL